MNGKQAFVFVALLGSAVSAEGSDCTRPNPPDLPAFFDTFEEVEFAQSEVSKYIKLAQDYLDCMAAETSSLREEASKVSGELDFLVDEFLTRE